MALSAGTRIGPYEILAPIGKGGMGDVYRAKDTKLKREVAVKVLPEVFASDRERMARFRREAEVLASLNHPNIAHLYAIEEHALVMELVPGETLKGPLPLATALNYARQIAEALEVAHEKGIIHRDLKPANIIVTPEGVVKVLDFGLAAVLQRTSSCAADPADSPTLTQATEAGMIMGTAAYMSPEQASGKAVDRRSDIWSFGVVLFKMLTGKSLFGGEALAQTLADVLLAPIDLNRLPANTPIAIRELLRRCLNRDLNAAARYRRCPCRAAGVSYQSGGRRIAGDGQPQTGLGGGCGTDALRGCGGIWLVPCHTNCREATCASRCRSRIGSVTWIRVWR
jgi:serine/threonine-protein kinase